MAMLQQPYRGLPKRRQPCTRTHTYIYIYLYTHAIPSTPRETAEKQPHPKKPRRAAAPARLLSAAPGTVPRPRSPSQPWERSGEETLLAARPGARARRRCGSRPRPPPDLPGSPPRPEAGGAGGLRLRSPHGPSAIAAATGRSRALPFGRSCSKTLQTAFASGLAPRFAGTLRGELLPRRKSPMLPAAPTTLARGAEHPSPPDSSTDPLRTAKHKGEKKGRDQDSLQSLTNIRKGLKIRGWVGGAALSLCGAAREPLGAGPRSHGAPARLYSARLPPPSGQRDAISLNSLLLCSRGPSSC